MRRAPLVLTIAALAAADAAAADDEPPVGPAEEAAGYSPPAREATLAWGGYVDLGFANAQGDGTSFHPDDARLPADYGVDAFAPAVNARGEAASTDAGGRLTNGFLPRSAGIGGRPSFLVNTVSLDLRYEPAEAPLLMFARAQLLPRFSDQRGSETRMLVEQAFARYTPFESQELAVSVGKMDSVFGIEYLDNQANLRTGITPSLMARYTTGPSVGAKAFYRMQIAPLWSAVSLNVAASNAAPFVESLQPAEASLTGRPVGSARLGYELNLPRLLVKLGASAMAGPRNDQGDPDAGQRAAGADARIAFAGLSLTGEYVHVDQDRGRAADKRTGAGPQLVASEFHARGFYATAAWELPRLGTALRRATIYARLERRRAWFEGFAPITVARLTGGVRLDFWDLLALKAEALANRELDGAPSVPNDVVALSAVYVF